MADRAVDRRVLQVSALGLAVACIGMSLLALVPAVRRVPGNVLLEDVTGFRPLPPEREAVFAGSRASGAPSDLRELGRMALAAPDDGSPESAERLNRAIALLEEALRQAPADSFAWADLALAHARRDGPSPRALQALRLSIATAPAEPALVLWRVGMMLDHVWQLTEQDARLLERQILNAWTYQPRQTVQLLRERAQIWRLRVVLDNDPEQLARLTALEKLQ